MTETRASERGEVGVVISDVHANARALRRALEVARSGPLDHLVFLGDLLTYGIDVGEVLDLVEDAQSRYDTTVVLGNHDQLYLDVADGKQQEYLALPEWIRESVDYTLGLLDLRRFRHQIAWSREAARGSVLFAHANPFGYGDWRYLRSAADCEDASRALHLRGRRVGVFGHTHRAMIHSRETRSGQLIDTAEAPIVVNAGSIGQPRSRDAASVILRMSLLGTQLSACFEAVEYSVADHVAALRKTWLTPATLEQLAAFFVAA